MNHESLSINFNSIAVCFSQLLGLGLSFDKDALSRHDLESEETICWKKFSADSILKYFSYFPQKTGFDISCKLSPLETICMKCQTCFWGKIREKIYQLPSAELAQRVVKVKMQSAHSLIIMLKVICSKEQDNVKWAVS